MDEWTGGQRQCINPNFISEKSRDIRENSGNQKCVDLHTYLLWYNGNNHCHNPIVNIIVVQFTPYFGCRQILFEESDWFDVADNDGSIE